MQDVHVWDLHLWIGGQVCPRAGDPFHFSFLLNSSLVKNRFMDGKEGQWWGSRAWGVLHPTSIAKGRMHIPTLKLKTYDSASVHLIKQRTRLYTRSCESSCNIQRMAQAHSAQPPCVSKSPHTGPVSSNSKATRTAAGAAWCGCGSSHRDVICVLVLSVACSGQ